MLYKGKKEDKDSLDNIDDIIMLEDNNVEALGDMVFQVSENFKKQDMNPWWFSNESS